MGSVSDPGEVSDPDPPPPDADADAPSFDDFQRQTSLMTSCTLLWKELSDHFTSLEQNLLSKSESLKIKLRTLDEQTRTSLSTLERRETSINDSVSMEFDRVERNARMSMEFIEKKRKEAEKDEEEGERPEVVLLGEVDDSEGLLTVMRKFCLRMEARKFLRFLIGKKKEIDLLRKKMPTALAECVDPPEFVLEAISEVFPIDKRAVEFGQKGSNTSGSGISCVNDMGWACVLMLESLIPVVVDPVIGKQRMMVTPSVREKAKEIAETWRKSLEERGGVENVRTPDVHTFLQHLVTFGIVKEDDLGFYRKLVIASAWRKQMPKLAVWLGLESMMPDIIEELINRGQQLDAVHFTYEVGLVDKFPPVPLLKAFLKDAKKAAAATIFEDPNNAVRATNLAARKEQSAVRAVIKCIEEYKLEAQFPPENLKKRLELLEKAKNDKKRQAASVPASKRIRVNTGGPMPPAKAGHLANAYVSTFPAAPAFVRSPSHGQYPAAIPPFHLPPPLFGSLSLPTNPYAYSPEAASPPLGGSCSAPPPVNYAAYGCYGNGMATVAYQPVYYR